MKTKILISSFLIATFLWSCSDDSDLTVILKQSGDLKVELTQNGTPVNETMVYLIPQTFMFMDKADGPSSYIEAAIDMVKTDEDGIADFGEVNVGNYYTVSDGVPVGSLIYLPGRTVQVISDVNKKYTMEATDYSGTITITVNEYNTSTFIWEPASGYHVAIIPSDILDNTDSDEEAIAAAFTEDITNTSGMVTFNIPSGYYYYAIVYATLDDVEVYDLTYLETGEEYNEEIDFND